MSEELPRIIVPQGDPGGIGPEVALKTLADPEGRQGCRALLLGHFDMLAEIVQALDLPLSLQTVASAEEGFAVSEPGKVGVLELENALSRDPIGQPAASFGLAAVEGVLRGGSMCMEGRADALLTPPIHKESMHLAGYPYEGQTQILGELCRSRRYGMLACNGALRVLIATRHMALKEALQRLDVNLVAKQIRIAHEAAREVLGMMNPRIALAGLNPHAGEGGAFGREEAQLLAPAIRIAHERWGFETVGPCVPDVVFKEGVDGQWDLVIALYHDQAFIPLKLLGREQAYTVFVGGPILRVSPMHGAGYDIAGTGQADPASFGFALARAIELAQARRQSLKAS